MRRSDECFVYFVRRSDGEGPVKIGCSQRPENRLSSLMAWAPYPLTILATMPGDEALERRLHAKFEPQHSHREWFHWTPELGALIASVAAGAFDPNALPVGRRVGHPGNLSISHMTRRRAGYQSGMHRVERRSGFSAPEQLKQAINDLDRTDPAAVERTIQAFTAYRDAPHVHGVPCEYPWARKSRAAHLARLGLGEAA